MAGTRQRVVREVDQEQIMYHQRVDPAVVWHLVSISIFPGEETQLSQSCAESQLGSLHPTFPEVDT